MGSVHPKLVLQEAKALEARGEVKAASLKYSSLIPILMRRGKYLEAVELCEKTLSLSPSSTRIHLAKALCLSELQRKAEAQAEIQKLAVAAVNQQRLTQYLELAEKKLVSKPHLFQIFLEKLLEIDRTQAKVFYSLAQVLMRLGKSDRAFEIVFAGLKTKENCEDGYRILKELITERGRKEDFQYFEKLINGAWPLEKVKQFLSSDAKESFDNRFDGIPSIPNEYSDSQSQLKSLDEENVDTLKSLIQVLEEELGETPQGIESVSGLIKEFKDKAVNIIHGDPGALLDLAFAFREMGLTKEAQELVSQIPIESEKFVAAQVLLGEIEFDSGSLVGALDIFQKILRDEKLEEAVKKESLYHVARIYLQLGEPKKADEFMEKLAEIDSHYRGLMRLKQAIKNKLEKNTGT